MRTMGHSRSVVTAVALALAGCGRVGFTELFERAADGAIIRIGDSGQPGDGASMGDGGGDATAFDCDTTMPTLVCPQGTFCETPLGACTGPGHCAMPPPLDELCPTSFVCGCNEQTYSSTCAAERAGVSILARNMCN